jgi:hypothetical protein
VLVQKNRGSVFSNDQAWAHLLCKECEQRFSRDGEDWMLRWCWRSENRFRLHDALSAATPVISGPGLRAYNADQIRGVRVNRLIYFAASVFWRGGIHRWYLGEGEPDAINLGPFEEPFRKYLNREALLPDRAVLWVNVSQPRTDMQNRSIIFPCPKNICEKWIHYQFAIPGVGFSLLLPRRPSDVLPQREHCITKTGLIVMGDEPDAQRFDDVLGVLATAPRRGKLAGLGD